MTDRSTSPTALYGRIQRVATLTPETVSTLYQLASQASATSIAWPAFLHDLSEKSHLIVLRDRQTHTIKGYCGLVVWRQQCQGRRCAVVVSGDTVIDQAYRDQRELSRLLTAFLGRVKLSHPTHRVYWLLAANDCQTYLQLTDSVFDVYPRHDRPTPALAATLLDRLARCQYADDYVPELGVVHKAGHSRGDAGSGDIPAEVLANPHARFFAEKNPGYRHGHELVCVGELTLRALRHRLSDILHARLGRG